MLLNTFLNKDKITEFSKLEPTQQKLLVKKTLLQLEDLSPIDATEYDVNFLNIWNRFVNKTHSTEELSVLVECFYNDQKYRVAALDQKEAQWKVTSNRFNPHPTELLCAKTGWILNLSFTTNSLSHQENLHHIYLSPIVCERYELAKLFCLENIQLIYSEHKKETKGDDFINSLIQATKPLLQKLNPEKLTPIDTMGYDVDLWNAWNKLVAKAPLSEDDWYYLCMVFSHDLYMKQLRIKNNTVEISNHISTSIADQTCRLTGTKFTMGLNPDFSFKFKQWEPKQEIINGEKRTWGHFVPIKPMPFKNKIYEKTITFKTGNLIINDWFRTTNNEFSDMVKTKTSSINYDAGRVEHISHYADNFNFVSVNVGNSCPNVYKKNNTLYFGEGDEESSLGMVCTDLWNVSVIEEEQLVEILTRSGMSETKAQGELKKLKKISTCISLKVSPGKYKLKFMGDHEQFASHYKGKAPKGVVPYFTLEKIKS